MKRKRMYSLVLGLMLLSGLARAETPNIIVIYADDLGYGDLGCYGADTNMVQTPNIDSLASAGRRFTDAHSASAVCTPSRFALLTGEYPFRDNHYAPIFLRNELIIPEDTVTVADVMKSAGYATGIIGKWHLGFQDSSPVDWNAELKPGPLELGFDYYYGVPTVNSHPPFVYVENHHVVGHVYDTNSPAYDPFDYNLGAGDQGYTADVFEKMKINDIGGSQAAHALYDDYEVGLHLAGKAVDWIDANKADPFFLILATTHIHHPFTPAPQFKGTSGCGLYGDFLHELDYIVGMLLQKLEDEGLTDDTLIIFTADNGGMLNVTGQEAWDLGHRLNGELLGFKSDGWEGGHRVPFIAKWPGHIPTNTVSDQLISGVDMLATMAALTETPISAEVSPDGVNILQALAGEPAAPIREHLVCMPYRDSFLVLRSGDWAYFDGQGSGGWNSYAPSHTTSGPKSLPFTGNTNDSYTVSGSTVSLNADASAKQLYNLATDLSQITNLYDDQPAVAQELDEVLAAIEAGTVTSPSSSNVISWTIHPITTSESDVITAGTTHTAVNNCSTAYASANPTIAINGVSFSSTGADLGENYAGDGWTATGVDSEYDKLLSTVDYENSGTGWFTVHTFADLIVGRDYLLQVWYAASAQPRSMTLESFDADGSGDVSLSGLEYAVGQFTAESTAQDLVLQASANGPRITGYQLRLLPDGGTTDGPITIETLLNDMVDRSALARYPETSNRLINFSSYNRASDVGPPESGVSDTATGWFANGDYNGKYLYTTEEYGNGTEYVMVDHQSPGALVRFWTPWRSTSSSTLNDYIRIYLDGSTTPVIEGNLLTLFDGTGLIPYPFGHPSLRSAVSFFPIPYAERCVVTLDRNPFFYIFTHREYDEGTAVETFTMDAFNAASNLTEQVGQTLLDPSASLPLTNVSWQGTIAPNAETVLNLPAGTNAVHEFTVVLDENSRGNRLMRSVIVKAEFDGQETIWCPLGDFFGSGVGLHPFEGWYRTVESNGTLSCRWVMPYQTSGTITLENLYDEPVELSMSAATEPWEWDEQSLYFHSGWRFQSPLPTRPWSDWNYITLTGGRGVYVGDSLTLWNPVTGWWGEGDHKIWVDGEDFPSMFGTGTEDYYAYSWGGKSTDFYDHPFHAQVRAHVYDQLNPHPNSPGYVADTSGYSTETRTRALDTIVFTNSLQLDMEVWHGTDTEVEYAVATHWYSDLSLSNSLSPDPVSATLPVRVSDEPELSLSVGSLDFGTVFVGSTRDLTVTVENSGAGTLSGSVSTAPPFSIVSGSNYVLTAYQQQDVVVRYTPVAAVTSTGNVEFAGTLGTNISVFGTASALDGTLIADIAYDYTSAPGYVAGSTAPTAPPTGWNYLYSSAASGGTEVALTPQNPVGNAGNSGFEGPAANNTPAVLGGITGGGEFEIFSDGLAFNAGAVGVDLLLHPGNSAATECVIVRYTISAADMLNGTSASITGSFRRGNSADNGGVIASVYHNTNLIWSVDSAASGGTDLPVADGTFGVSSRAVSEGDSISFVVDSKGNYGGDETALTGMIVIESPADSDGDNLPDSWEMEQSGSLTNLTETGDFDGDGSSDYAEFIAGTQATNPASVFAANPLAWFPVPHFEWSTVSGRLYSVYWSSNLVDGFQCVESNLPWTSSSYLDTLHTNAPDGFYQLKVQSE